MLPTLKGNSIMEEETRRKAKLSLSAACLPGSKRHRYKLIVPFSKIWFKNWKRCFRTEINPQMHHTMHTAEATYPISLWPQEKKCTMLLRYPPAMFSECQLDQQFLPCEKSGMRGHHEWPCCFLFVFFSLVSGHLGSLLVAGFQGLNNAGHNPGEATNWGPS